MMSLKYIPKLSGSPGNVPQVGFVMEKYMEFMLRSITHIKIVLKSSNSSDPCEIPM